MSNPFYKDVPSKAQVTKDAEEWLKHNEVTVLPPGPSRTSNQRLQLLSSHDLNDFVNDFLTTR